MTVVSGTPVARTQPPAEVTLPEEPEAASSGTALASRGTTQAGGISVVSGDRVLVPLLHDSLLFKDTPHMKRALFKSWSSLQVYMKKTLPELLEEYKQQVEQVRQTQLGHVRKLLLEACMDERNLRQVCQLIDNMCNALVDKSGPKTRIETEIKSLEKEFTEARGGIGPSLEAEIRRLERHQLQASVWHACKSTYTDRVRPCVAQIAPPCIAHIVPPAVVEGVSVVAFCELVLLAMFGAVSAPVAFLIGVGAYGMYSVLNNISSRNVSEEQVMREYDHKLEEANNYSGMCDGVEMFLQAAKKEIDNFTLCKDRLLQIKDTIPLLSTCRVDARKWSCDRLCEFFNKVDLARIIKPFTKNRVNGKAFLEDVTENMLREDFGVTDELTVRRVLGYQRDLASGADVEAIEALRHAADSIDETLRGILAHIQTMRQYVPVV